VLGGLVMVNLIILVCCGFSFCEFGYLFVCLFIVINYGLAGLGWVDVVTYYFRIVVMLYYICGGGCVLDLLWLLHLVGYRYCFVNCYCLELCYFVFML